MGSTLIHFSTLSILEKKKNLSKTWQANLFNAMNQGGLRYWRFGSSSWWTGLGWDEMKLEREDLDALGCEALVTGDVIMDICDFCLPGSVWVWALWFCFGRSTASHWLWSTTVHQGACLFLPKARPIAHAFRFQSWEMKRNSWILSSPGQPLQRLIIRSCHRDSQRCSGSCLFWRPGLPLFFSYVN